MADAMVSTILGRYAITNKDNRFMVFDCDAKKYVGQTIPSSNLGPCLRFSATEFVHQEYMRREAMLQTYSIRDGTLRKERTIGHARRDVVAADCTLQWLAWIDPSRRLRVHVHPTNDNLTVEIDELGIFGSTYMQLSDGWLFDFGTRWDDETWYLAAIHLQPRVEFDIKYKPAEDDTDELQHPEIKKIHVGSFPADSQNGSPSLKCSRTHVVVVNSLNNRCDLFSRPDMKHLDSMVLEFKPTEDDWTFGFSLHNSCQCIVIDHPLVKMVVAPHHTCFHYVGADLSVTRALQENFNDYFTGFAFRSCVLHDISCGTKRQRIQ